MSGDKTADQSQIDQFGSAAESLQNVGAAIAAGAQHVLPQARRHFPQIRIGTKIGNFLRRHQPKSEEQQNTVPKGSTMPHQMPKEHNSDGNGTAPTEQQLMPKKQQNQQQVELNSQTSAEELAEVTDESTNEKQRENANANGAEEHGKNIGEDKPATSCEPISAPEARQKWGRRRSSVVHPLESDQQQKKQRSAASARPPNAFRFGPSSPTPWIYLQMADRSFRRTTVAQLQTEHQQKDGQTMQMPSAKGGQLLAPEFASVTSALTVQNVFHRFALIVQGFMAGLTFGHTFFAFFIADLQFIERDAWMAAPAHAFFHFCLAIGIVEALDRFEFGTLFHFLCSLPSLGIAACFFAFLASISSAQIEESLAQQAVNDNPFHWDSQVLFTVWQLLSAVRAVCAMFGWLTMAIRPTANATRETLAKMLLSNSLTS